MAHNRLSTLIQQYDEQKEIYKSLTEKTTSLIIDLLIEQGVQIHSISSRLKDRESLIKKIDRGADKYINLKDITDISGIRVITYFDDDVNKIAKIIEDEFKIDSENTIDKKASMDPDRFGYLSLHYVCSFSVRRCKLAEYKRFRSYKFELQIRSILQHAWAEIEHDLGYKSKLLVPKEVRRRFSRLAGLLEIADNEFVQLREQLVQYEKGIFESIKNNPELVSIDLISLKAYLSQNDLVKNWDKFIATNTSRIYTESEAQFSHFLNLMNFFGIKTIYDLHSQINIHKDKLITFSKFLINHLSEYHWEFGTRTFQGSSLIHLSHLIVAEKKSDVDIKDYFALFQISDRKREELANAITRAYEDLNGSMS